ncbi:MAG: penicillin acylase family protein [Deltaproteobacteria bacterium]|uniref:Penicillin acylase family protein n=1 Tax=Candidatus Zymogenus saltonus TaxID=2844893 RepID=A0A9D8KG92_9DELT|nr:penicillin acylase family protein [Candidatus Zymogenus saltonus]
MKIVKYAFIVAAVLIIATAVFFQVFFRVSIPKYSGTLDVEGLTVDVEIRTDEYGVPHIFAENERDLFFAQGYITARERMFQMDMTRLAGRGELSTLFGKATEEMDRFLKTVGFYRTARLEYEELPQEYKEVVIAYTNGVNAYLDSVKRLPREYAILRVKPEKWVVEDTVVTGLLMAYSLTRSKKTDLILYRIGEAAGEDMLDLITPSFPDFAPRVSSLGGLDGENRVARSHFTRFNGGEEGVSNGNLPLIPPEIAASNWMIFSGSKTTTGAPIFTGSPDLEPKIPSLFYVVHLSGGDYDVIGGSIPGMPGVNVLGFNGNIAWSNVNGRVDELDYFIEKVNPKNKNQYLTEKGYVDFGIVEETLKIKKKGKIVEEKMRIKISRHGPIISDVMSLAPDNCAMMWVGNKPCGIIQGCLEICKAGDFDEFRRAISLITTPTLNVGYADAEGNIGYQYMASPPIRKKGNGTVPVPGWTGEYDWVGNIPFERLPYDLNPKKGYLGSFNNEPKKTDYHVTNFYLFERATRFEEMAKGIDKMSLDDAHKIQLDSVSVVAERWVPIVVEACSDSEDLKDALALFDGWNFASKKDSPAASLFNSFYYHMMGNTLRDNVGEEVWEEHLSGYYIVYVPDLLMTKIVNDNDNLLYDDIGTEGVTETRNDMVVKSMKDAVTELTESLGANPEKWAWEKVHRMTFKHPMGSGLSFFNLKPIPTDGDGYTINAGMWDNKDRYEMVSGGVIRMIVDFSDVERSTIICPPGQSGHFKSPHYDDLAKMWAEGGQIPMHYLTAKELPNLLILKKK